MKKLLFLTATIALFVACNNDSNHAETADAQNAAATTGTEYTVDSTSLITWVGSKPTGSHDGTLNVSGGSLFVDAGNLTGGNFVIDIHSLTNADLAADAESQGKLVGHLKSSDFFDAEKFPTAKFEITAVEPYVADSSKPAAIENPTHTIKGNLSLKDSTKNISFPAKVTIDANSVSALADFTIDRTEWGMNYKGPNNPQDWVISKSVGLKVNLTASKK